MYKRLLSAALALCLVVGLLPASAMAEGEQGAVPGLSPIPGPAPIAEDGAAGLAVYTLRFDANGGDESSVPETQTISDDTGLTEVRFMLSSTAPTRAGYVFLGWAYTDAAAEPEVSSGEEITLTAGAPERTLYAVWTAQTAAGSWGNGLTWVLGENGTLIISGTGEMDDCSNEAPAPWYESREKITAVEIKDGVTKIGTNAFMGCSRLTGVTLADSITTIGMRAFRNCSSLTGITLPRQVTKISDETFKFCSNLTEIMIPQGVTAIQTGAFSGCSSLMEITLPTSVTSIGSTVFSGCSSLKKVVIPQGVTSIGTSAFSGCTSLTGITLPTSVTSIGEHAFYGCTSLTGITLPDSVASVRQYAFSGCTSLTGITLPTSVTSIGEHAFYGCTSLAAITVPAGAATMGAGALSGCTALTDVRYGGTKEQWETLFTEEIGAFVRCSDGAIPAGGSCGTGLTWSFEEDGTLTISGTGAMPDYAADGLPSWDRYRSLITAAQIETGVSHIGNYAFNNCAALSDVYYSGTKAQWNAVTVGTGNELLKQAALHYEGGLLDRGTCGDNLTWVLRENGTLTVSGTGPMTDYDGDAVIFAPWYRKYSSAITALVVEEGVTSVGNYAFMQCAGLTEITLPDSVTRVGDYAFTECRGLTGAVLPKSLKDIGQYAFSDCSFLTDVSLPAGVTRIEAGTFSMCTRLAAITIPQGVTHIGAEAFSMCTRLAAITIPQGVTHIGAGAFSGCGSLTKAAIPQGITTIAEGTFRNCGLTEVSVPESVKSIEPAAFFGCSALSDVYYAGTKAEWEAIPVGASNSPLENASIRYRVLANGQCGDHLTWVLSADDKTLVISGTGEMWDYSASSPSGWKAWQDSVERLLLPQGLTRIGEYAFSGCSALAEVILPPAVVSIGDFAFYRCGALSELTIPGSATEIGASAFCDCSALARLSVLQGVKTVGMTAFAGCTGLRELSLPESVTEVDISAFYGCSSLQTLSISKGLKSLGENAFKDCSALRDIYYTGSAQMWQALISSGNASLKSIAVHYGMLQLSYDPNGGSGSMAGETKQVTPGSPAVFTAAQNSFTAPAGSRFDSWNTAADGSGTAYAAGSSLSLLTDTTLYARWKEQAQLEPGAETVLNIDDSLQVVSGKKLNILDGIDIRVTGGAALQVDGILKAAGRLINESTLFVSGQLDAAQGIENQAQLTLTGGEITSSSAKGTLTGGGTLRLSGGTVTNTGEGPALALSQLPAVWDISAVLRSRSENPVLVNGAPYIPAGCRVEKAADGYYYLHRGT